jgi:hypothetical protein
MLPPAMLEALRSDGGCSEADQAAALDAIYAGLVLEEGAHEDPAGCEELCAMLRSQGVAELCAALLAHPSAAVGQRALLLLSAMTTADIDPSGAAETRSRLRRTHGGGLLEVLLRHLASDTVVNACAAAASILNLYSDEPRLPYLMEARGGLERLRHLAQCEAHACLVHVASLCLSSLTHSERKARALHAALRLQRGLRRKRAALSPPRSELFRAMPHSPLGGGGGGGGGSVAGSPRRTIRAMPSLAW